MLGTACLCSATGASVSQVVMGAIQVYIVDDTGWDYGTLSLAVTAGTWCSGVLSPLAGAWADRYGPRVLTPLGLLAVGCALLALSAVNTATLWPFFVAYVVARTLSNPLLIGIVPRTATVNFFRRRRGVTLAINGMARPVGGAINIQIISLIAATHSWRASYGYVGLFMLVLTVPVFLIMRRTPEEIGMLPDGDRPAPGSEPATRSADGRRAGRRGQAGAQEFSWTAREAMKTRAYWCIAGTAVLAIIASAGLGYILVPFLVSESGPGLTNPQAVGVGSLGAVLALTTLIWGFMADKFGPRPCMVATISGAVLSGLFLAMGVHSVWTAYLFAVLWGFFSNTVGTLEHMLLAQYFGRGSFGAILGSLGPLQTGALGFAPVFGSYLLEFTHSYTAVFIVLMAMYAGAGMLILLAKAPRLPPRAMEGQADPSVAPATV
ncbi:MAG: MFS transporter [Chloroflexota bacterium]|nr:MFS transporter [Chloroflexota bacterium]MDE2958911.1 MFS transporter [Chloroflexota bacterium]